MNVSAQESLVRRGELLLAGPFQPVRFTGDPEPDTLLNDLEAFPHAFVTACLMDRHITAERAWAIPLRLRERLGSFAFADLERLSREDCTSLFSRPQALHRYNDKMAGIFHAAIQRIGSTYQGEAARIWAGNPSSAAVVRRFLEFPGAGPKIATMAANILARGFKVPMSDHCSIDVSVDVHVRRTMRRLGLVRGGGDDLEIVYAAREISPLYPGVLDAPLWELGREWCRPTDPLCGKCPYHRGCPSANVGEKS